MRERRREIKRGKGERTAELWKREVEKARKREIVRQRGRAELESLTVENKMWRREENKRGSVRKIERVNAKDFWRDVQHKVRINSREISKFRDTGERETKRREARR